jgi:hypothetical protein
MYRSCLDWASFDLIYLNLATAQRLYLSETQFEMFSDSITRWPMVTSISWAVERMPYSFISRWRAYWGLQL